LDGRWKLARRDKALPAIAQEAPVLGKLRNAFGVRLHGVGVAHEAVLQHADFDQKLRVRCFLFKLCPRLCNFTLFVLQSEERHAGHVQDLRLIGVGEGLLILRNGELLDWGERRRLQLRGGEAEKGEERKKTHETKSRNLNSIDQGSDISRPKTVIDVDRCHIGRARVQHR
jgi:hypothetical protein